MDQIIEHDSKPCQVIKLEDALTKAQKFKIHEELFQECKQFVKNIVFLKDSPWQSEGIVGWIRAVQGIRLGSAQETVLRFLQREYFIKNKPCFAKQSHLGQELGISRPHINQILKSLEDKNLIVMLQRLHYNNQRKNDLILPLIPSLIPLFKDHTTCDTYKSCMSYVTCKRYKFCMSYVTCKFLFCKPPKSQQFPSAYLVYNNILYTNTLFKNNEVKINNVLPNKIICSNEHPKGAPLGSLVQKSLVAETNEASKTTHIDSKSVDSKKAPSKTITLGSKVVNLVKRKNTIMLDRFLLKRKNNSNQSIYQPIFDKLKTCDYEFDKLSVPQQNDLTTYLEFYHFINIRSHFKISTYGKKNPFYTNLAVSMRKKLIQIIADGFELQWDYAHKIIEYWNASPIEDTRFKRIRVNTDSKNYKNAVIVLSHCLIYQAKKNMNTLFKVVDRLERSQKVKKAPFHYANSTVKLINFFLNLNVNNGTINYLGSDIEFKRWIGETLIIKKHKERINIAFNYFSEMYIDQFYSNNKENGKETCYKCESMIKQFLQERIREIVDVKNNKKSYREMHGYSLVEERSNNGHNIPPLLQRYLFYIYKNPTTAGDGFLLKNICQDKTWDDFIETHMRIEVGLNDFYRVKRRDK